MQFRKIILILTIIFSCSKEPSPQKFDLTVTASTGGTVSSNGGTFDAGTEIVLTAIPEEGYAFKSWEGINETTPTVTLILDKNTSINALFELIPGWHPYDFNQITLTAPPFDGTIFITGDIITAEDPSLFEKIEYKGTATRQMYDRRNGGAFIQIQPHLFDTTFADGLKTEIQINPEFNLEEATKEANKYAFLVGQLSKELRKDVQTMWIHKGKEAYGGGNNNILIHTGMTEFYENFGTGIVEETIIHEAAHTSIDAYFYPNRLTSGAGWIEAVEKDNDCYISTYAQDYPYREDIAELFPLYIAVRYFPERISDDLRDKILSCSLNRIRYFDAQGFDMSLYEN